MGDLKRRLVRLEAGASDALTNHRKFELRRQAAEKWVRLNIEEAKCINALLDPAGVHGGSCHTFAPVENPKQLADVERAKADRERSTALDALITSGALPDLDQFLAELGCC